MKRRKPIVRTDFDRAVVNGNPVIKVWMAKFISARPEKRAKTQCIYPTPLAAQQALMKQTGPFDPFTPTPETPAAGRIGGTVVCFWDWKRDGNELP